MPNRKHWWPGFYSLPNKPPSMSQMQCTRSIIISRLYTIIYCPCTIYIDIKEFTKKTTNLSLFSSSKCIFCRTTANNSCSRSLGFCWVKRGGKDLLFLLFGLHSKAAFGVWLCFVWRNQLMNANRGILVVLNAYLLIRGSQQILAKHWPRQKQICLSVWG